MVDMSPVFLLLVLSLIGCGSVYGVPAPAYAEISALDDHNAFSYAPTNVAEDERLLCGPDAWMSLNFTGLLGTPIDGMSASPQYEYSLAVFTDTSYYINGMELRATVHTTSWTKTMLLPWTRDGPEMMIAPELVSLTYDDMVIVTLEAAYEHGLCIPVKSVRLMQVDARSRNTCFVITTIYGDPPDEAAQSTMLFDVLRALNVTTGTILKWGYTSDAIQWKVSSPDVCHMTTGSMPIFVYNALPPNETTSCDHSSSVLFGIPYLTPGSLTHGFVGAVLMLFSFVVTTCLLDYICKSCRRGRKASHRVACECHTCRPYDSVESIIAREKTVPASLPPLSKTTHTPSSPVHIDWLRTPIFDGAHIVRQDKHDNTQPTVVDPESTPLQQSGRRLVDSVVLRINTGDTASYDQETVPIVSNTMSTFTDI